MNVRKGLAWAQHAIKKWRRGRVSDVVFQKDLDTYRALLLLEHRALAHDEAAYSTAQQGIVERADGMEPGDREERVQVLIHQQVKDIMHNLAAELGEPGAQSKLLPSTEAPLHRVAVRPSSIPSAGNGVFVTGNSCRPGSVVLFIPGLVYYAQHAMSIPGFPAIKDPLYMMTMTQSRSIIDPYQVVVEDHPLASTYFAAESLSGIKPGHAGHTASPNSTAAHSTASQDPSSSLPPESEQPHEHAVADDRVGQHEIPHLQTPDLVPIRQSSSGDRAAERSALAPRAVATARGREGGGEGGEEEGGGARVEDGAGGQAQGGGAVWIYNRLGLGHMVNHAGKPGVGFRV